MTDIVVPPLGESVSSATIARWMKKVGEAVAADEPLVELETDKVTVEVNAAAAGVLESIDAAEGAEVGPGAVLGRIAAGGAAAAPKPGWTGPTTCRASSPSCPSPPPRRLRPPPPPRRRRAPRVRGRSA